MPPPFCARPRLAVAPIVLIALLAAPLRAEDKTFVVTSGDWFAAASWSPPGVPAATDTATIAAGHTARIEAPAAATIAGLLLDGGTLDGGGSLSVTGPLRWTSGAMNGAGETLALGELALETVATLQLGNTRRLRIAGDALWTGPGSLQLADGAEVVNAGSLVIQTPADVIGGAFDNQGTLEKVGVGGGNTRVSGTFANHGSVVVSSGELQLDGAGEHSGPFSVAAGAILEFGRGAHVFDAGADVAGAGHVRFTGGTSSFNAVAYDVGGASTFSGGTHTFTPESTVISVGALAVLANGTVFFDSGETIAPATYAQSGGTLGGADAIVVTSPILWSGGTINGSGTFDALGGMSLPTIVNLTIGDTRTVRNAAVATWTGVGSFQNASGGVFENSGTLAIQTAADFLGGAFVNTGTVTKTLGLSDGRTVFTAPFANSGEVQVNSGILELAGGYTQSAGATRHQGGQIQSTGFVIDGGVFLSRGIVVGPMTNAAVVEPGLSPGILTLNGPFTQTADGRVRIEIGSRDRGDGFDIFAVAGAATLAGTLEVALINGFVPTVGDQFRVVTFFSRSGDFTAAEGLVVGNGFGFRRSIDLTGVTLEFVREICDDGQDNDADGATDCADPKCADLPSCGGPLTPTATRTASASSTPTSTRTTTPTRTFTAPTDTPTDPAATSTPSAPPSATATAGGDTPTRTATPLVTPEPSATGTSTPTPTATYTATPTRTASHTFTTSATRTFTLTITPTRTVTSTRTVTPTRTNTPARTETAAASPTTTPAPPTATPQQQPSASPSPFTSATATATSGGEPTPTPTGVEPPTATATADETVTPTPTATLAPTPECAGDCNLDGSVGELEIGEVIVGLFDQARADACGAAGPDGTATAADLLAVVGNYAGACP